MSAVAIPFVDLHAQYLAHRAEIDAAIAGVIARSAYIGGEPVRRFEASFAADYGVEHCIPVANGTDAIYIALRMLGVGPGDEVITTAHSWISTAETIVQAGARPVFVDVDAHYLLDADQLEAALTPRTRAVIPVHLAGQAADMGRIGAFCERHGLWLIEDCAQAHYAEWRGRRVGSFGHAGTFSFYPGKNLGAYGDAGAIVTADAALAERMRMYASHGALKKHDHRMPGLNSRLDGLQAAILSAKLPHIHDWTRRRRALAARYDHLLAGVPGVETPRVREGATHVWHLYMIQVGQRDGLRAALRAQGIETVVHYPVPLPLMPAFADLGGTAAAFPRAAANVKRILSLPLYPEMTEAMVERVVEAIRDFQRANA